MRFTDEQVNIAMTVPIVDILDLWGEKYHKESGRYIWDKYDSIRIQGNRWYRFSEGLGGGAISFVEKFDERDFASSVGFLLENFFPDMLEGKCKYQRTEREDKEVAEKPKKDIEKQLKMPRKNFSNWHTKFYLINERCIDSGIVRFFIHNGSLYTSKRMGNAVFVGKDKNGFPRHAHSHGTMPSTGSYRVTEHGSDSRFAFGHFGGGDKLYVFEAPIDLMSFVSIYQKDWQAQNYISLCGISKNAIIQSLHDYPNIKEVVLCLDNDEAGQKASENINTYLKNYFDVKVSRLLSQTKDWNEDLQNIKGFVMYSEDSEKNEETEEEEWGQSQY